MEEEVWKLLGNAFARVVLLAQCRSQEGCGKVNIRCMLVSLRRGPYMDSAAKSHQPTIWRVVIYAPSNFTTTTVWKVFGSFPHADIKRHCFKSRWIKLKTMDGVTPNPSSFAIVDLLCIPSIGRLSGIIPPSIHEPWIALTSFSHHMFASVGVQHCDAIWGFLRKPNSM